MQPECEPCASGLYSAPGATECDVCGMRDPQQRTALTGEGEVGATSPYGIDCAYGVVGYVAGSVECDQTFF